MAPNLRQDECPICQITLSQITDGSEGAKESHVSSCIESHLSAPSSHPASASKVSQEIQTRVGGNEGDYCPICHTSYLTQDLNGSESAREAHFNACFESISSISSFANPPVSTYSQNRAANNDVTPRRLEAAIPSEKGVATRLGSTPLTSVNIPIRGGQPPSSAEAPSNSSRRFSIFGFGSGKTKEQKSEDKVMKIDGLIHRRWGPPGSPTLEMVRRYWMATRMEEHWEYLRAEHPKRFKKYLEKGYMEPIPVCTGTLFVAILLSIIWHESSEIPEEQQSFFYFAESSYDPKVCL